MKEQIYTIPVNEVYDSQCDCPLCKLEERIENESVEYTLGAAMMEPDFRVESNEKGYCFKHYEKLFKIPNKLSLALILDTHLMEVRKSLDGFNKKTQSLKSEKISLFKKSGAKQTANEIFEAVKNINSSCLICDKVNFTMNRYIDVILYMWSKEEEFKKKFEKSNGFCLKHFGEVCQMIQKVMSEKDAGEFLSVLFEKEYNRLNLLQEDIHKFTLKFDYRNKDMPWGTAQDAPLRTIETLAGKINKDDN